MNSYLILLIGVVLGLITGVTVTILLLRPLIGNKYQIERIRAKKGGSIDIDQFNKDTQNTKEVKKGLKKLFANRKIRKLQRNKN